MVALYKGRDVGSNFCVVEVFGFHGQGSVTQATNKDDCSFLLSYHPSIEGSDYFRFYCVVRTSNRFGRFRLTA